MPFLKKTLPFFTAVLFCVSTALADNHLVSDRSTIVDALTAKEMLERGVLFVDVRSATAYANGHIPTAVNIDVRKDDFIAKFTKAVRTDQEFVFYCRGSNCDRSPYAILLVSPLGYEKIYYFREGVPGWREAGYELEK